MADITPAATGNTTRGIPSFFATRIACTGPLPPKATMDEAR